MSKKTSNNRFIMGLAVAFLLPLSFYAITAVMSRGKIHIPHYYIAEGVQPVEKDGKTVYDTIYHHVGELTLTNQLGNVVSLNKDLKGKIMIVNFFFVNCPTICPHLSQHMGMLQNAFRKTVKSSIGLDTLVQLISITVNPSHDTPAVLRTYADRYNANHDHWWFLTGDKKVIYNYARNELHLSVQPGDGGADDFIHTEKFVLIDENRHIRGYYDGTDSIEIKRCADDVVLLTKEKRPKK